MTGARISIRGAPIERLLNKIKSLEGQNQSLFLKNLYPWYQKIQQTRWTSQGASEGKPWTAPSKAWTDRKIALRSKDAAKYPGGQAISVFTGTLMGSVTGRAKNKFHRVMTTPSTLTIITTVPYASYVNKINPFVGFGPNTRLKFRRRVSEYIRNRLKARG